MKTSCLSLAVLFSSALAYGQSPAPCPQPGGVCLTADEKKKVVDAVQELKKIKDSPAVLVVQDPVEIITDWDGRTYVNAGTTKPLRAKLTITDVIDRDMAITLDAKVAYRPKPPDPMFRLRIRAQAGILLPQAFQTDSGWNKYDVGIGWDFFHIDSVNLAAYTGTRSAGGDVGLDLTRNFGVYAGYAFIYDGFKSGALLGGYFSFN